MRRSTTILILLFILMAGAYYFLNNREKPADIAVTVAPDSGTSYLFTPEDGLPTYIHIESKEQNVVEVTQNTDKAWAFVKPIESAADQGSVEAAASQVSTLRVLEHLPDIAPKDVGLDTPEYKMTMKFTSGVERNIEVGVVTPTESGYYVRVDGGEIVIVSKSALDSLLELLNNPPYLPTETPPPPTPESVSP